MSDSCRNSHRCANLIVRRVSLRKAMLGTAIFVLLVSSAAKGQWGPDVKLSTDETAAALNENMGQCVVANGDAVHVVWMDARDKDHAIYYKRSTDKGATWGVDTRISGSPGADTMPLLAQSGSILHLVFLRNAQSPQSASYYKRSTDGGLTWGPDVLLGNTKWWPGVAASGSMVYVSLNTVTPDVGNSVVNFRRSTDGGATWEPEQHISQAVPRFRVRSEDPAIVADGKYVHLVWNDNRDAEPGKGMSVYYRRSSDMGATWEPEMALTHAPAYTYFPTIFPFGSHVEIAHGDRQTGHYHIYHLHSPDFGATWPMKEQISNTPDVEFYPAIVRDGSNIHLAWTGKQGIVYLHSGDGGTTWDPAVNLVSQGAQPFIAVTGTAVHVIFVSKRDGHAAIYYKSNPTGNKSH